MISSPTPSSRGCSSSSKGVGETQRPSPAVIRSTHFGLHYVVHKAEKHPRVIEAHACLVLPDSHPAAVASRQAAAASPAAPAAPAAPADKPPDAPKGIAATIYAADAPAAADVSDGAGGAPLPPLVIPESGLDDVDLWLLRTYATLERRCRRTGVRAGVTYFEESWL